MVFEVIVKPEECLHNFDFLNLNHVAFVIALVVLTAYPIWNISAHFSPKEGSAIPAYNSLGKDVFATRAI